MTLRICKVSLGHILQIMEVEYMKTVPKVTAFIYPFKYGIKTCENCSLSTFLGVTIVAKNDYCDTIDIAGIAIAILLLVWTTMAILL